MNQVQRVIIVGGHVNHQVTNIEHVITIMGDLDIHTKTAQVVIIQVEAQVVVILAAETQVDQVVQVHMILNMFVLIVDHVVQKDIQEENVIILHNMDHLQIINIFVTVVNRGIPGMEKEVV